MSRFDYGTALTLTLENRISDKDRINLMVFCTNNRDAGKAGTGVHLDLNDHPIQSNHLAREDSGEHEISLDLMDGIVNIRLKFSHWRMSGD